MTIKKSEHYSSLWKSCDELRGGMDASQYKDYVLVLLFVKYVSDKYAGQPNALIEVPVGGSFADMVALKGNKEIGDKINKIIARLAEANDLKGVIDVADFNDADKLGKGKEMQDRLSNLVAIFENPALNFRKNRAEGDDILGDAYEYLMRHFATESGKSKGQFYTPAEVSRVIAKVIGISKARSQSQTIYDPTCGSGSLLLKAADESQTGVTIYGQEMDNATAALAKMNMILHDNPTAEIWQDNSLSNPYFKQGSGNKPEDKNLKTFDFVVANPPFSNKAWSNGFDPVHDLYQRFEDGVPPRKNGDYAFLLHIIRSLKSTGKGRSRDSHEDYPQGVHQRHHRPAAQPVLWHRHPCLYHRPRQGKRSEPHRYLHDRRQQGLCEGWQQEPPAPPGHPQDCRCFQQANRTTEVFAHGECGRNCGQRLQSQYSALHRQLRGRRHARH